MSSYILLGVSRVVLQFVLQGILLGGSHFVFQRVYNVTSNVTSNVTFTVFSDVTSNVTSSVSSNVSYNVSFSVFSKVCSLLCPPMGPPGWTMSPLMCSTVQCIIMRHQVCYLMCSQWVLQVFSRVYSRMTFGVSSRGVYSGCLLMYLPYCIPMCLY